MSTYVLDFQENGKTKLKLAGGKGANLCALSAISGIRVPEGFCVTTAAYKKTTGNHQELKGLLDALACLKAEERSTISAISEQIRTASTTAVELLGPRDHLGSDEPGKPTHLIAIQGGHHRPPPGQFVMKAGVIVVDTTHRLIC